MTQLEELKQQQKLDRQKEQEKKRKLDTNSGVEPSNVEPVKEVRVGLLVNEMSSDGEIKAHNRAGIVASLISHGKWRNRLHLLNF